MFSLSRSNPDESRSFLYIRYLSPALDLRGNFSDFNDGKNSWRLPLNITGISLTNSNISEIDCWTIPNEFNDWATCSNLIQPGGELFIYKDAIKLSWDKTISTLGKLQGLVILKKISSNDCKPVIETLLAAIDKKISVVNEILEQNITQTGGNNINTFKNKYLKYKMKYLNLKNNM